MNLPAVNQAQGIEALALALANAVGVNLEKVLAPLCAKLQNGGIVPAKVAHECGGACGKSDCDGQSCGMTMATFDPFNMTVQSETVMMVQSLLRGCTLCRKLDPCVAWMYANDRRDFDSAAWEQLLARDGQLVHVNKYVGAAPYEDLPLEAGKKSIFSQTDEQQLSYWPELIKLDPDWTGTAMPTKVTLKWYTGPKGLTGLTDTSALLQIGETQTLADYACGTSCYLVPFPEVKLCAMGHIPNRRAVYLEVLVGAVGEAVVTGIGATIIKRGTALWARWAPKLGTTC